jgi:tetratricopeptide (TPR) repeat protein
LRQSDAEQANVKAECEKKLQEMPGEEAHTFCDQLYDPDNPEKLTALGTIYGQHGDPAAALKPFRRAAELSSSPQVKYNLALAYFQLNRFQEARGPLESALQRWPDLFQLNALYGAVLAKLGEDVKAAEALRRAHQLNPQDAPVADLLYQELSALASTAEKDKRLKDSENDSKTPSATYWKPRNCGPWTPSRTAGWRKFMNRLVSQHRLRKKLMRQIG